MARRVQGAMLWFVAPTEADPTKFELIKVGCPLSIDLGTDSKDKIETTCIEQENYKTYLGGGGLKDLGQATFDINVDPTNASHIRLYDLQQSGVDLKWVLGWAGAKKGAAKDIIPTLDAATGDITLPKTRSWNKFDGYVDVFPFKFDANTIIKTSLSIQRQTEVEWIPEETA